MSSHAPAGAWLLCWVVLLSAGCGDRSGPGTAGGEAPPDTGLLARIGAPVDSGAVRLVRVLSAPGPPAFAPDTLRVRAGDVVRFVSAGPAPRSIAFDTLGLAAAAAAFVAGAGLQHGPLLLRAGQTYDVSFRGAPAGVYPFRVVPRAESGGRGAVIVGR